MKIGISRASRPEDAHAVLQAARRHGFAGVQLKPDQFQPCGMTAAGFEAAFPGLSDLASGGLIAYAPGDWTRWGGYLAPIVDFAAAIAAPHICICSGVARGDASAARFAAAGNELMAQGRLALDKGVQLSLHNHAGCLWESADDIKAIRDRLDPAVVGLTIDTGHCAKAGIADIAGLIGEVREHLINLHLKDLDSDGAFCPIGSGTVDLPPVLAALQAIGYGRWLIVDEESMSHSIDEAFAISTAFLRSHDMMNKDADHAQAR